MGIRSLKCLLLEWVLIFSFRWPWFIWQGLSAGWVEWNNRLNRKGLIERISASQAVGPLLRFEMGAKLRDEI